MAFSLYEVEVKPWVLEERLPGKEGNVIVAGAGLVLLVDVVADQDCHAPRGQLAHGLLDRRELICSRLLNGHGHDGLAFADGFHE
jgi:hypothetical protein